MRRIARYMKSLLCVSRCHLYVSVVNSLVRTFITETQRNIEFAQRRCRRPTRGYLLLTAMTMGLSLSSLAQAQSATDTALNAVRNSDRAEKNSKNKSGAPLPAAEHARRATIYMANRAFPEAREHWQALIDNYPNDASVPAAIFGIARSYFIERRYEEARQTYERVARDYPQTKEGREGLNFSASSLLRMGRGAEAAARYQEYLEKYPNGERIDTAHLNIIDGYREAGRPQDAIAWIDRTRGRFAGPATETKSQF